MDILSVIRSKNPDMVTRDELVALQRLIEEAERNAKKLQRVHRELTGRHYVPPIRLK